MPVRTYVRKNVCMHVFLDGWMNFCWFAYVDTHVYLRASLSTQTTIEIYCSLLKLLLRFGMYCFLEQIISLVDLNWIYLCVCVYIYVYSLSEVYLRSI